MAFRRRVRIANRRPGGLWWRVPTVAILWAMIAAPIVAAIVAFVVLRDYASGLPTTPNLERWEETMPRTNVFVAADGTIVAEIPFSQGVEVGHRFPVTYDELPEQLIRAILAAEDVRFFEHSGVDVQAVARAAWKNYQAGEIVEGASTITQQVARNMLPEEIGYERSLRRKVREALLARRIEQAYSKQRILETYVNHAFLGAGSYGVRAAARAYFSKGLDELSLAENALIAGLAQAPGRADPYKDMAAAKARRDEVLERMLRHEMIDQAAHDAAVASPIDLHPPPLRYGTIAAWHTERARQEIEHGIPRVYAKGGLVVETSAIPVQSMEAEREANDWIERVGAGHKHGTPQVGALVWDYRTGYVETTIGGRAWTESRFDRSTQACRQPGSAFKPIVYGAAIESDAITAGTALRDAPIAEYDERLDEHWKPTNSGRTFRGVALAHDALVSSLNAPAVDVFDRVGAPRVIELAKRLGITTELADVRPLVLGASCVYPMELAGAFAVFARGGVAVEPVFVVRVIRRGEVIVDHASPYDPHIDPARRMDRLVASISEDDDLDPVVDDETAWLMSNMLRDVVRRGTGTRARSIGRPAAGKTGTTNDNSDAWFVGYTGRVVSAVWVGHDNPKRGLGSSNDGSHAALPLWIELVRMAEDGRDPRPVPGDPPWTLVPARIDRETGYLSQPGAGGSVELYFRRGTAPTRRAGQVHGVPTNLGRTTREF